MKIKTILVAAAVALAAPAFAQKDDHSAKHGGIFVETKALDFEIVAKPDLIQVYVGDHGKPVKLDGAKGKVTLLNGSEKTEVDLAPAGDKLEAKGSFKVAKGTKGIASVTLAGKSAATARFEVK
ncbi:hypothetical protein [Ramlibacter rhizophilus]|uniref:Uncharacterized protein n=1 Tax=Ramlibacter rhizophilus TaxID=1781167 RepID=A0A4Z0BZC6_9BURK|nr:hypothetical protein [Ramlibacter rhizophilus]TFZ04593.1 hypothetical protein EZ242_02260 [Ramlibacter rhizophilus]